MDTNAETPASMETSNSMPSLDPIDDPPLPVDAIEPDAVDDVVNTAVAVTLTNESSTSASLSTTATYISTEPSTTSLAPTETSTATLATTDIVTPETSGNSEITAESEGLILNSEEIQSNPPELSDETEDPQGETDLSESQVAHNDSLDDTTDDPSEAIDQFIKKIADEQLSSKRSLAEDLADNNVANENIEPLNEERSSQQTQEMTEPVVEPEPTVVVPQPEPEPESEEPLLPPQLREELLTTQVMPLNDDAQDMFPARNKENSKLTSERKDNLRNRENMKTDRENKTKNQEMDDRERLLAILKDPDPEEPESYLESISAPSDVSKDPELIKEAQKEINRVDVMVCGNCHEVFHFMEDFQSHKLRQCIKKIDIASQCKNESKPQVWGFTLWKAKHTMSLKKGESAPSSWSIYQRWCKLSQVDKDAWITAGQTLQFCSKISNAQVMEFKPKPATSQLIPDKEHADPAESNKENNEKAQTTSDLIKRGIIKPVKLNNDVTILPSTKSSSNTNDSNSNKAIRTTKVMSTQKQEYAVEKIVAKRFNPRRKTWEYQIKWENFPSDANTWEPVTNLNHCKQMLDQFEEQLKKFKEEKAKQALGLGRGRGRPKSPATFGQKPTLLNQQSSSSSLASTPGRPTRSSKQKALDQVKAWCGTMSDEENSGGVKRQREDDDSDDSFEKKIKYEEDSDYTEDEDEKPKLTIKKTPQKKIVHTTTVKSVPIIKNGASSPGSQVLPANILVPDANGVVRINQKQLPSLSTGVYIMSKTAGIIKLDSTTSKVATSGGQTIVKVAPKIGQTQIKIVKKEGGITKQVIHMSPQKISPIKTKVSSNVQMISSTPKMNNSTKTIVRATPKIKKPDVKVVPKPKEEVVRAPTPPQQEDSDDGLEPLEFPTDAPLPDPESPPGEFVLDPTTGKIAGKEYPEEKEVVIMPEPGTIKKEAQDPLDNIVKLAAADITEDDLKTEAVDPLATSPEDSDELPSPPKLSRVTGRPRMVSKESSILNKALTGGAATLQKGMTGGMRGSAGGRPQQRILNHSIAQQQKAYIMQNVPAKSTLQLNKPRQVVTRPSPRAQFNISPQPIGPRAQQQPKAAAAAASGLNSRVQVFSNKSPGQQARRVGNTIIRSAAAGGGQAVVQRSPKVHTVYKVSPKREGVWMQAQAKPQIIKKRVISMPSLFGEEDTPAVTQVKKIPKPAAPKPTPRPITRVVPKAPRQPDFSAVMEPEVATTVPAPAIADAQEPVVASNDAGEVNVTDLSSFTLADSENPIFITGDDGTVYQVAGQNEQGQTILITQGADGQQQCLLVTNEIADTPIDELAEPEAGASAAPAAETVGESAAAADPMEVEPSAEEESAAVEEAAQDASEDLKEPLQIKTDFEAAEQAAEASDQVVAQVVRAEPPSPGGTHKVVVMLPDGNLMVTQVSPEEYASLELE